MHQPPAETNPTPSQSSPRRSFLRTAGLFAAAGTGALALPNIARAGPPVGTGLFARRPNVTPNIPSTPLSDEAVLNFALNLEYLDTEYYLRAVTGQGLSSSDTSGSGPLGAVTIKSNPQVPFVTPVVRQFAEELVANEVAHVRLLRDILGKRAVARPALNLQNSFNTLAQAAGLGSTFDPFADEDSFLLGVMLFEDLGATAYNGALRNLSNRDFIQSAGGLLGTESYQAGVARTFLISRGITTPALNITNAVNNLNSGADRSQGLLDENGSANFVPTDDDGLIFSRTTAQVLNVVYLNNSGVPGGFFPNGLNGIIR